MRCALQRVNYFVELLIVEKSQHEELLLNFFKVNCLHLFQHILHRLKRQILQYWADLTQLLLHTLLSLQRCSKGFYISTYRNLIYCGHYVAKNSELEEKTKLNTGHKHLFNLVLSSLIDNGQSFKAVAKELRQVVVVVLIDEFEVWLNVGSKVLYIKENLPKALLYQRQDLSQLDIAHARDHVVRHWVILVT